MHTDEWLYGSIRKMRPEIRAVWVDAQAQADLSVIRGTICAAPGVGYSVDQLAAMWNTPKPVIEDAFKAFVAEEYITVNPDLTITLIDWLKFQSEYQRVKKYKNTGKNTEKDTEKNTEKGTLDTVSISNSVSVSELNSNLNKDSIIYSIPDFLKKPWAEWEQHRQEKKKPLTPLAKKKQLAALVEMGEARAVAAINHSIANGYQGIFEPRPEGRNRFEKPKLTKELLERQMEAIRGL